MLFFAGVDDGDAVGEEDVAEDVFRLGVVGCVASLVSECGCREGRRGERV